MNREQRRQWRRHMFGCADLTHAQRLVLLALETFADFPDGTNARPGVDALAQMCGFGERVVRYALKRGRALKLIERTARANPKAGLAATYRLLPLPVSTGMPVQLKTDATGTTMPVEPNFNRHETNFHRHGDDISTGTTVPPTNRDDQAINTNKRQEARMKGTYLPADWSPPPEVVAQMRAEQPHVDLGLELQIFRDHWRSTTRNAMKRDWTAAYRNWIRRAGAGVNGQRRPEPRSTADERVRQAQALKGKFASSNQLELR